MQTTRRFYHILNPYLYRNNIRRSHCSGPQWAARREITSVAQKMFKEGPPARCFLNRRYPWTSIVTAASNGHDAVVILCLEWGADPNPGMLIYPDGKESEYAELTPIWAPLVRGHKSTLRTLFVHIVKKATELGIRNDQNQNLEVERIFAHRLPEIINTRFTCISGSQTTPLIRAVRLKRSEAVRFLLGAGANPNLTTNYSRILMSYA